LALPQRRGIKTPLNKKGHYTQASLPGSPLSLKIPAARSATAQTNG